MLQKQFNNGEVAPGEDDEDGQQSRERQRTDVRTVQREHAVAERADHAADLAVAAFVDAQLDRALAAVVGDAFGARGARLALAVADVDAAAQQREVLVVERARAAHDVGLLEAGLRIEHAARELAVIGEQQEPAGLEVEASHRREPSDRRRHQVADGGAVAVVDAARSLKLRD